MSNVMGLYEEEAGFVETVVFDGAGEVLGEAETVDGVGVVDLEYGNPLGREILRKRS